jgi:hypothetical protein
MPTENEIFSLSEAGDDSLDDGELGEKVEVVELDQLLKTDCF